MTERKKLKYDSKDQMAFDVLAEFGVATSHAITQIMGEKQGEALVGPEWYHAGLAATLNVKNRIGLEAQGSISAMYVLNWMGIIWADAKVEITNNCVRWSTTSCPWSKGTSVYCSQHTHIVKAITEICAPEHRSPVSITLNPKSLSRGDKICIYIMSADEGLDIDQAMASQCTCEPLPPPLSLEEMALWNHSYMGGEWTAPLKSMLNELGPETTMNALQPKFKEIGKDFANRFKEEYKVSSNDFDSMVKGIEEFHSCFLKRGGLDRTFDGFEMTTNECPYSGEPSEICQLFQSFYEGLLEEIHPSLIMKNSAMMTKGDKTCHWTISKKGSTARVGAAPTREDDSRTALKALAFKYAQGEITKDEYDELKKLIQGE